VAHIGERLGVSFDGFAQLLARVGCCDAHGDLLRVLDRRGMRCAPIVFRYL
jgi:hypothetical protein